MRLLMRGILSAILTVVHGGAALLEHPAEPSKLNRPSIWKTGVIRILINSGLFSKYTFNSGAMDLRELSRPPFSMEGYQGFLW